MIPAATIYWVVLLVATGVGSGFAFGVSAAFVAVTNVTVGVLVFQATRLALRGVFANQLGLGRRLAGPSTVSACVATFVADDERGPRLSMCLGSSSC